MKDPRLKNGKISCEGSVARNIGADWLNFKMRGFVKKFVCKQPLVLEVLPR